MDLRDNLVAYMQTEIGNLNANDRVKEAMAYSLISNGKMIRPLIFLRFVETCTNDIEKYYPLAMAIEMIHVYSLIHDDLPVMDNDDLRRGKPTNHVVFGEDIAILAGDALLTHSFDQISKVELQAKKVVELVKLTVQAAGVNQGMINGQVEDILNETSSRKIAVEELMDIHIQKTAKMIELPLLFGAVVCDREKDFEKLKELAIDLGLAFQIRDDYLDLYGSEVEIGKAVGKDRENNKLTYVDFYSKSELETIIGKLTKNVLNLSNELSLNKELIAYFAKLETRSN